MEKIASIDNKIIQDKILIINPRLVVSQDNWEREELMYKEACSKKTN